MTLQEHLETIGACAPAREWAGTHTAKEAWEQAERADWLLWWAARTPANTQADIVKAACACARTVLHLVGTGEERPRLAIEAAENWANSPIEVNKAAAEAAARAAAEAAAWAAAEAAEAAARAAEAAASAAWAAAKAAEAAASAAWAAAKAADEAAWAAEAAEVAARAAWAAAEAAEAAEAAARAAWAAKHMELCSIIRSILKQPWEETNGKM